MMFDRALAFVLRWEGGEGGATSLPGDPGGLTRWGISQRAYPGLDIAALTREEAAAIYRRDYWEPARCERFPPPLALALFDAAVMHGVPRAAELLQRALQVDVDGILGPATITTAWQRPVRPTLVQFLGHRGVLYDRDSQDWLGWYARLCDLAIEAMAGWPLTEGGLT